MNRDSSLNGATLGAALCAFFIFQIFMGEPAEMAARAEQHRGEKVEIGAALYSLHCRSCHGATGEGIGQLGPALSDEHFFTNRLREVGSPSTLRAYILASTEFGRMMGTRPFYAGNGHTMVMPPWHIDNGGPLREDELQSIADFILNWQPTATGKVQLEALALPRSDMGSPEVIGRGERYFMAHCNRCHAARGHKAAEVEGPDLTGIGAVGPEKRGGMDGEEYIRESVLVPAAVTAEGYEALSRTEPCGAVPSQTELDGLVAFLLH